MRYQSLRHGDIWSALKEWKSSFDKALYYNTLDCVRKISIRVIQTISCEKKHLKTACSRTYKLLIRKFSEVTNTLISFLPFTSLTTRMKGISWAQFLCMSFWLSCRTCFILIFKMRLTFASQSNKCIAGKVNFDYVKKLLIDLK